MEQIESELPETRPERIERIEFGRKAEPDRLVHADALSVAGTLADATLDAIYIDPPFGTISVMR